MPPGQAALSCMRTAALILLLLSSIAAHAYAQDVYLAPARSGGERLLRLAKPEPASGIRLVGWASLTGDNNVLPLSRGDDRRLPPLRHGASNAYFAGSKLGRLGLSVGAWSLTYSSDQADLYKGNRDAAQLYLDSKSGAFDPAALGAPVASMSRSAAARWRVGYLAPVRSGAAQFVVDIGASYVRTQRVQFGRLEGATVGESFTGDLMIESTRPFERPANRGHGFSLDVGGTIRLGPRASAGIWVDNLIGFVDVGHLQVIQSTVKTNQVQTDPDGFLTNAPVLGGTVTERSARLALRRRVDAAAAFSTRGPTWALLYRGDYATWFGAAGIWRLPGGRWWFALWSRPGQWEAGVDWRGWTAQIGFASANPESARQAVISLGFRQALGR